MAQRPEEQETVYLETSLLSYLTARPSRDVLTLGRQELTRQWWEEQRARFRVVISPTVIEEAQEGDPEAAQKRLAKVQGLELLQYCQEVEDLARQVRAELRIPERVSLDAFHVAYSIHYEVDYLLTWNCGHIANAESLRRLADFCLREDLWLPIVCTPMEMVGERSSS